MDMVCLEPYKIQKRQTISRANFKIWLILNIWHLGELSTHSLKGLPYTVSACMQLSEVGWWTHLLQLAWTSRSLLSTLLFGSHLHQEPSFLHTLCREAQMLTFISLIPWAKKLPELSSLWGQPSLATACFFFPLRTWFCNTEHRDCHGLDAVALFKQGRHTDFLDLIFCHFKKRQKVKPEAPLTWSSLLGFSVYLWSYCICYLKKWKGRMDQIWDSFYSYSICAEFKEMVPLFATSGKTSWVHLFLFCSQTCRNRSGKVLHELILSISLPQGWLMPSAFQQHDKFKYNKNHFFPQNAFFPQKNYCHRK